MRKLIDRVVNSTDTFKELVALYIGLVVVGAVLFGIAEEKSFGDSRCSDLKA
jgi:hypothetical protein